MSTTTTTTTTTTTRDRGDRYGPIEWARLETCSRKDVQSNSGNSGVVHRHAFNRATVTWPSAICTSIGVDSSSGFLFKARTQTHTQSQTRLDALSHVSATPLAWDNDEMIYLVPVCGGYYEMEGRRPRAASDRNSLRSWPINVQGYCLLTCIGLGLLPEWHAPIIP